MAKYYLQWYRGATKKGSFSFVPASSVTNPWTFTEPGFTYSQSWATFQNLCVTKSNKLIDFPTQQLWGCDGTYYHPQSENRTGFVNGGPNNIFEIKSNITGMSLQAGDVLYIGKRQEGSHITVASISGSTAYLNYVCGDGTVAYQNVPWEFNTNSTRFVGNVLPWIGSLSSPGNWSLQCVHIEWNSNFGYMINYNTSAVTPTSNANAQAFWNDVSPADEGNPYEGSGETGPGGGRPTSQNWDDNSDTVTADAMPTLGAVNSGMLSLYSPTVTQVQNLADLLFSYNFFDWLQKNLQNLEEIFVSFGVVPFTLTKGNDVSVTWLGFDVSSFTHPVYLKECTEQYYEFDMGSIALDGSDDRIHASDSVFDYSPFSKLGIYLPFIGFQELDIDECRGSTVGLRYRVDIVSGSCVAIVSVAGSDIYQFSGNCLTQIPLGSVDMSGIVQGSIAIATAAASAGIGTAVASAGDAFAAEQAEAGKLSEAGENLGNHQRGAQVANSANSLNSATANGIMGMKPHFKHSGAIGSSGGLFAVKQPYLFLTTPREAVPREYQKYCGFPSNITGKLSEFSGYTVVENIRLNGLVATSAEVEEIYNLLKSGIII